MFANVSESSVLSFYVFLMLSKNVVLYNLLGSLLVYGILTMKYCSSTEVDCCVLDIFFALPYFTAFSKFLHEVCPISQGLFHSCLTFCQCLSSFCSAKQSRINFCSFNPNRDCGNQWRLFSVNLRGMFNLIVLFHSNFLQL